MGGHVFLSYCRDDRDYVDELAAYLGESGVPVWFDDHLAPGDQWLNELRMRIEDADAVVVVMTPAAEQSDWVRIEIQQARDAGRPILPLLLDGRPFPSLHTTHYQDVSGRRLPGEAFLARLRSAPAAPPAGLPARMADIHPDQVADVIDVREDCATATTVLALLAQMLRALLNRRVPACSAAITIGAVKVVLPREYGRRGRIRPLRVDHKIASAYETAVSQACRAIGEVADDRALARGQLRDGRDRHRVADVVLGSAEVEARVRTALHATDQARVAARALAAEVYAIGVHVCGFDLSTLVVDDLERLDGFLWDSTTRWPRKLVDAVFERSITAGDGTMLIRTPTGSGRLNY
jgi:hypothetical protein